MGRRCVLEVALYFLSAEVYLFSTPTCPEFIITRAAPGERASRNSRRRCGLLANPGIAAQTRASQKPWGNHSWLNACCVRKQFFSCWVKLISIYGTNNPKPKYGSGRDQKPVDSLISLFQGNPSSSSRKTRPGSSFFILNRYLSSGESVFCSCLHVMEQERLRQRVNARTCI